MAIDPKKVLRPTDIYGLLTLQAGLASDASLNVEGTSLLNSATEVRGKLTATGGTDLLEPVNIIFTDTSVTPNTTNNTVSVINDVVTITATDAANQDAGPVLVVDGIINNRQFFPLNRFIDPTSTTEAVLVKPNEGIIVPIDGKPTRYFLNRSINNVTVTPITDFDALVDSEVFGDWLASGSCTVDHNVSTFSINWNNADGSISASPDRNWNMANDGATWTISGTGSEIIALCDNELLVPLALKNTSVPPLELVSASLTDPTGAAINITNDLVPNSSPAHPLVLDYPVVIVNTDVSTNNTWTFTGQFLDPDNEETFSGIIGRIMYLAPTAELSTTITAPRLSPIFDEQYTAANIIRTFNNGDPTSFTSVTFGGNVIFPTSDPSDPVPTTLSFIFNRGTSTADKLLEEVTSYTNATNSADVTTLTRSTSVEPANFTFPFYLGSVTTTDGFDNTAATAIVTQGGTVDGSGNPLTTFPAQFAWPDISNSMARTKIFGIRTSELPGDPATALLRFKASERDGLGVENTRFTNLSIGRIAGTEEDYSFFIAQTGQPGATSLYVEFV